MWVSVDLAAGDASFVAFGAAVVGALVGGLATVAGAVWAERRKLTRSTRVRMFDELLPVLDRLRSGSAIYILVRNPRTDVLEALAALRRSAVIAGRSERRLVAEVQRRADDIVQGATFESDAQGNSILVAPQGADRERHEAALAEAIQSLEAHLERKIG